MPPRHRIILILLIPLTAAAVVLFGALLAQPAGTTCDDFHLTRTTCLSAAEAQWLELIALAPLAAALAFAWNHAQPDGEYFQPEMIGAFGWWIVLANAYAVAYMLTLVGPLPVFEPAIQSLDDARLRAAPVDFPALALIIGAATFFGWFVFFRRHGFGRMADRIVLPHRRIALLILLAALAALVWLFGGVVFAALMIPPAWFWILIEPRVSGAGKAVNVALSLAGATTVAIAGLLLPGGLNLWHILLAAAYGVLAPLDVLPFLLLAALFLRFLRLGVSEPYTGQQSR